IREVDPSGHTSSECIPTRRTAPLRIPVACNISVENFRNLRRKTRLGARRYRAAMDEANVIVILIRVHRRCSENERRLSRPDPELNWATSEHEWTPMNEFVSIRVHSWPKTPTPQPFMFYGVAGKPAMRGSSAAYLLMPQKPTLAAD